MKKLFLSMTLILIGLIHSSAQAPQNFNYQAVVRDGGGNPVVSKPVVMRFIIRTNTIAGAIEYEETQALTTSAAGMVNAKVGTGTKISVPAYAAINWGASAKFLQVKAAVDGAAEADLGGQVMSSVPYANFSGAPWATNGANINNVNTGNVGINFNNPTAKLSIAVPDNSNDNPADNGIYVYNNGAAGDNDDAIIATRVNGAGSGDPFVSFDVSGVSGWSMGMDNSDGDKFKVSNSWNSLDAATRLTLNSGSNVATFNSNSNNAFIAINENDVYRGYFGSWAGNAEDVDFGTGGGNNTGSVHLTTQAIPRLTINAAGRVGIGTTNPQAPLHVKGFGANCNPISIRYFNNGTPLTTAAAWSGSASAIFDDNVIAGVSFIASNGAPTFSDKRFKNIIGQSSSKNDLASLLKIKITDYTFIDQAKLGSKVQKKVIAQEVEEILPSAVNTITTYAPSIYTTASTIEKKNNQLTISLSKTHDLKIGDKVKWIDENGHENYNEVTAIHNAKSFTINTDNKTDKVFVYGKEINDFRTVDYDAISMLNVSATQELHKQIEILKAELSTTKASLRNAEMNHDNLKAEIQAIKEQISIQSKNSK